MRWFDDFGPPLALLFIVALIMFVVLNYGR